MAVIAAWFRFMLAGTLGLTLAGGAVAAGSGPAEGPSPVAAPRQSHVASLAPRGASGSLRQAQVLRAAQVCASHAAAAGWANNGVYGGSLVTATAVCIAESGGHPRIYHCDTTGAIGYYPPVSCKTGFYDRGLWQLNSHYQSNVPDACAFRAQCNANAAYRISGLGTSFSPWAVYDSDFYAAYLGDAQAAVSGLTTGAVASGVFGVCLARSQPGAGASPVVVVGNCGRRTGSERWTFTGGTLTAGGLCLTAAAGSGQPGLTLAACTGGASQRWASSQRGQLKNRQTGWCLDDPGAAVVAGAPVTLASCTGAREETWWLP
jgi:hypothetical protein